MKSNGKNINLFLIDGEPNGKIKCTLSNWIGIVLKIPRIDFDNLNSKEPREELKFSGIYFLIGISDEDEKNMIYIGQANKRQDGNGLNSRINQHLVDSNTGKKNSHEDFWQSWQQAIIITTRDDTLGSTELNYLEHYFHKLAKEVNRYEIINDQDPAKGNITEEKESEMQEFIEYAKLVVGAMGYPVFEPYISNERKNSNSELEIFYCNRNKTNATSCRTSEGFVLQKGSKIADKLVDSCGDSIRKARERYKDSIGSDFITTEDILFRTPSGASSFVLGSNTNGNIEWKTKNGITLKDFGANNT